MISSLALYLFYILITCIVGYCFVSFKNILYDELPTKLMLPFLGLSIIVSLIQNLSVYFPPNISIILILFSTIVMYFKNFNKFNLPLKEVKNNVLFITIFLISAFIYLYPSIWTGFPTSFTSINNDLVFYLSIPEWLKSHRYFSPPLYDLYHPFNYIAHLHFSRFSRVGSDYFNVFSMNFLGIDSIHTFNILSSFYIFLIILSSYITCYHLFKLSRKVSIAVVCLVSVNSFIFWTFACQYMPQLAGVSIYILCLGLYYSAITNRNYKLAILSAIITSALISIYSEYLVYLALPVFLFICIEVFLNYKECYSIIKISFVSAIVSVLFNPTAFYLAIKYNLFAFKETHNLQGIVQYIPFSNQILMVFGLKTLDYSEPSLIWKVISYIILMLVIVGYFSISRRLNHLFAPLYGFILFMLFYLSKINKFPYGYYKTLMFAQVFFIILGVLGLFKLTKKIKGSIFINSIIIGSLILCNAYEIFKLEKFVTQNGTIVTRDYTELNQMKNFIPENDVILVHGFNLAEQNILTYFLRDKKILLNNTSSYFPEHQINKIPYLNFNYVLTGNNRDITLPKGNIIWSNDKFCLYDDVNLLLTLKTGWYDIERWAGIPTRWTQKRFGFTVKSNSNDTYQIKFNAFLPPKIEKRTLRIIRDNNVIDEIEVSDKISYISKSFNVSNDRDSSFEFELMEGTVKVGSDPRDLGIAIQNLELFK